MRSRMGIALRDQSGSLRRSEDLLGDIADALARIEDPAERVRLAFKLFDSEGSGEPEPLNCQGILISASQAGGGQTHNTIASSDGLERRV
jgi:hypothetical protein